MQKAITEQSILERLKEIETTNSNLDTRARNLHEQLVKMLQDNKYELGHAYKIVTKFSDAEIINGAEYCLRTARNPAHAFVGLFNKKLRQLQ